MANNEGLLMRLAILLAAFASCALAVRGNPLAMPPPVPAPVYNLSAENVQILVGRSESVVSGDYTFRAVQDPKSMHAEERVSYYSRSYSPRIYFPVILPSNGFFTPNSWVSKTWDERNRLREKLKRERLDLIKPKGTISGEPFAILPLNLFEAGEEAAALKRFVSWTNPPATPPGWEWEFFAGGSDADPSGFRNELRVRISYNQPHLPGNVSVYLPLLPANAHKAPHSAGLKTNFFISFQAQRGVRFEPLAHYNVVGQPSDTNIRLRPAHLQLLQMQILP